CSTRQGEFLCEARAVAAQLANGGLFHPVGLRAALIHPNARTRAPARLRPARYFQESIPTSCRLCIYCYALTEGGLGDVRGSQDVRQLVGVDSDRVRTGTERFLRVWRASRLSGAWPSGKSRRPAPGRTGETNAQGVCLRGVQTGGSGGMSDLPAR